MTGVDFSHHGNPPARSGNLGILDCPAIESLVYWADINVELSVEVSTAWDHPGDRPAASTGINRCSLGALRTTPRVKRHADYFLLG